MNLKNAIKECGINTVCGTFNIGFNKQTDETQFDCVDYEDLYEAWTGFCRDNHIGASSINYIEKVEPDAYHKNTVEEEIIARAEELWESCSDEQEPEIGYDEEREMITLNKYDPDAGESYFVEDICEASDVDMISLREKLDAKRIYYVL